jgi:hypothetical protein
MLKKGFAQRDGLVGTGVGTPAKACSHDCTDEEAKVRMPKQLKVGRPLEPVVTPYTLFPAANAFFMIFLDANTRVAISDAEFSCTSDRHRAAAKTSPIPNDFPSTTTA